MLNIVENQLAGAEQNTSLPSFPSCNKVRCPEPSTTQNLLEGTSAKTLTEAPAASANPPPLAQLKSRAKEEIDWACDLDSAMTRVQAIARIKERLGIDLRWPTTYARFLQWRRQQRIQNGLAARLETFRQFEKQSDLPASLAAIESTAAALFLEQAILQQDAALFLSLLRLRLRERTLALQEKKLALEQARLQSEAAPQPPPQAVLAPPPAKPPREPARVGSSPLMQPKPHPKTQRPAAESKAKNTTLRRKTPFPSKVGVRSSRSGSDRGIVQEVASVATLPTSSIREHHGDGSVHGHVRDF